MLDVPNSRSSHAAPTPRGGGLLIVLCSLIGLWLAFLVFRSLFPARTVFCYSLGAILIVLISWVDDLRSVSNRVRFLSHAAGALVILLMIGSWQQLELPYISSIYLGSFGGLITFFWITGLTNAYNFMDGIDGIAGSQAVIAGTAWIGLGWISSEPFISIVGALIAGSSLGFLGYNWPPARIFMGDVGSAFLGYTFAVLPVMANLVNSRFALAGVLVVWPFLFDATFTLLRRLGNRENIFVSHRSHLYQRLVIAGYSHRFVTWIYVALALVGQILAFTWVLELPNADLLVLALPAALCLSLWRFVVHSEATACQ